MPTIENHAEHPFHFPKPIEVTKGTNGQPDGVTATMFEEAILFPRAGNPDAHGDPVPSRKNITKAELEAMQNHRVAKGWFGRNGLSVASKERPDFDPALEEAKKRNKGKEPE